MESLNLVKVLWFVYLGSAAIVFTAIIFMVSYVITSHFPIGFSDLSLSLIEGIFIALIPLLNTYGACKLLVRAYDGFQATYYPEKRRVKRNRNTNKALR